MWRVAGASEYLVVTGFRIPDVKLVKKAWVLPGQRCSAFDITPVNYTFDVQAMSAEKLPFRLPAVFTIGPSSHDIDALRRYAKLVAPLQHDDTRSTRVHDLVQGIIEGETRVLAASMTMDEIFQGTKDFKREVFDKVQLELNEFGLHIYNANVKQLVDEKGHEYFSYLGQKTQQEAANQAKVEVAEAQYKGEVGTKERVGLTLQNAARVEAETRIYAKEQAALATQQELKVDAQTKIFQNSKQAEIAEADAALATKSAMCTQQAQVAKLEADMRAAIREVELQKELELRRVEAETERLRAAHLAPAVVTYEAAKQAADAALYENQRAADATAYEQKCAAQSRQLAADAALYATMREADAKLYTCKQEASGLVAMANAQAAYVRTMLDAFHGDAAALHDYLLLDRGVYQEMGRINADAIQGLAPKISIWSTGDTSSDSAMHEMSNVFKTIPPLFTTIRDQTGVSPLPWLASLPPPSDDSSQKQKMSM